MAVSYDIGFVLVSFYVTFVLVKGHIPRVIGIGFLLGLGSVTFTLPHFITGKYEYGNAPDNTCPAFEECGKPSPTDYPTEFIGGRET